MPQILTAAMAPQGMPPAVSWPHDELAAALDAAVDELRTLQLQLGVGSKSRAAISEAAREVAAFLREVRP